jgi:glycosyltransferase involved in cell wall biosynthesis
MALGLPLVGSDSGSIPEVVGPAGLITREGDSTDLARALRRVCDEPGLRKRLAEAGQARFHAEFNIPAYARKIAHAVHLREKAIPA